MISHCEKPELVNEGIFVNYNKHQFFDPHFLKINTLLTTLCDEDTYSFFKYQSLGEINHIDYFSSFYYRKNLSIKSSTVKNEMPKLFYSVYSNWEKAFEVIHEMTKPNNISSEVNIWATHWVKNFSRLQFVQDYVSYLIRILHPSIREVSSLQVASHLLSE